jgi:hypothetical protein
MPDCVLSSVLDVGDKSPTSAEVKKMSGSTYPLTQCLVKQGKHVFLVIEMINWVSDSCMLLM